MRAFLLLLLIGITNVLLAQHQPPSFSDQLTFVEYLFNKRDYEDAQFLLKKYSQNSSFNNSQTDSLNYFLGKAYYFLHQLDSAHNFWSKVPARSPFYDESLFFNSLCLAYTGRYDMAGNLLNTYTPDTALLEATRRFELSGIALLNRDYEAFRHYSAYFTQDFYQLSKQQDDLTAYFNRLRSHKKKSGLVAGVLSAAVPGLGKIYAKKPGEGISTFFRTALVALPLWETYRKEGTDNAKFVILGSIFSIFYISNIWGSVVSVKVTQKEFNDTIDEQILVDMHIPLRSIFR